MDGFIREGKRYRHIIGITAPYHYRTEKKRLFHLADTVRRASNGDKIHRSELDDLMRDVKSEGKHSESGLDLIQRTFQSVTIRVVKSLEK